MAVFLDEAKINVKAGDGGNGIATFFNLKSGGKKIASGGNGGKGGDVIIKASDNITTLYGFKKKVHLKAENGKAGSSNNKSGKDGQDLMVPVPAGTIITDSGNNMVADLSSVGDEVLISRGGIGGRGNASFTSQSRRFPSFYEKGETTEESWINMELRLVADVALVGFPNAGKSTIISKISAARPKISDYPFTTLVPTLGVVTFDDENFVVADIPGVIEGAHKGTGLGHRFLRHITRSAVLAMVLDGQRLIEPDGEDLLSESYDVLRKEIKLYNIEVYKKDFVIIINKADLIPDKDMLKKVSDRLSKGGKKVITISAVTGEGINSLVADLYVRVKENRERLPAIDAIQKEKKKEKIYTISGDVLKDRKIRIEKSSDGFVVKNKRLERMVAMTDLENEEALDYLRYRLKKMKIGDRLKELGIDEGSTVIIGNLVFELVD